MMNLNLKKMALVALSATTLFACKNNSNEPNNSLEKGNSYARLTVKIKNSSNRAITDNQKDYAGRDAESKVSTMDLISSVKSKSWDTLTGKNPYTVDPWLTQAGTQKNAIVLNRGSKTIAGVNPPAIGLSPNATYGEAGKEIANIKALSTDDKFVMTSKTQDCVVKAGITKDAAKNGADASANVFKFDVERVVCQGIVAKGENLKAEVENAAGTIDLTTITYAAVNGAVKTYVFADNAGARTMTVDPPQIYADYKSAIDDQYTDLKSAFKASDVKDKLIRLGNLGTGGALPKSNEALDAYKAKDVAAYNADPKTIAGAGRGIFFMENSVSKEASTWTADNKNFGFYRLAYAKVYATFIPDIVYKLDGTKLVKDDSYSKGTTFYMGLKDGLFYANPKAAKAAVTGGQKAYCYTNGRCGYRALWNRQIDEKHDPQPWVTNADTRRNNIYVLTIDKFKTIGFPYDPSDPNDPNLPKSGTAGKADDPANPNNPGDPSDPDNENNPGVGNNPGSPDIEKQDTYMRVSAKVLEWNLVSRGVELD